MERLSERLTAIEAVLKKLEPVEGLLERVALLENTIYTTKKVFTFQEACMYIGVSESMLYKLTSNKEIPHYKPRGKMLYFAKEELDAWLLQNYDLRWTMPCVWRRKCPQPNRSLTRSAMENEKRTDRNSWAELDENRLSDILTASQIKATDTYETPPQIIWIDNSTIATLGNFSASTGKAKAKKTFNVSAIVAASLAGRQVLNYRAHLPEGKRRILYVDTEQSRFHCHNVLERILRLAGLPTTTDNENLDFICLREYTPAVRIGVIDYALRQNKGYGLVIIDGIRDLMLDINSTSESVEVINKMMEWSSKYDLHIHCVLHLNKGDNNVRGHIGTEMSNKAETVLVITKSAENPVISEVHALHIREKEFKPFAFSVDDEGLPVMVDNYSFDGSVRPKARSSFMDLSIEQHREALSAAFGDRPIKGFENVLQALMASYEAIGFKRGRSVMIKLLQYLTENLKLIVKRDKLFYYDVTPTEALLFDEECEEAEGEK